MEKITLTRKKKTKPNNKKTPTKTKKQTNKRHIYIVDILLALVGFPQFSPPRHSYTCGRVEEASNTLCFGKSISVQRVLIRECLITRSIRREDK